MVWPVCLLDRFRDALSFGGDDGRVGGGLSAMACRARTGFALDLWSIYALRLTGQGMMSQAECRCHAVPLGSRPAGAQGLVPVVDGVYAAGQAISARCIRSPFCQVHMAQPRSLAAVLVVITMACHATIAAAGTTPQSIGQSHAIGGVWTGNIGTTVAVFRGRVVLADDSPWSSGLPRGHRYLSQVHLTEVEGLDAGSALVALMPLDTVTSVISTLCVGLGIDRSA